MEPTDLAAPILRGDPALDDNARAELWNAFHDKNPEELAQHLQPLAVPDDTKRRLLAAKQQSVGTDPVSAAISKMSALDPQQLEVAENHPVVLKTLTAALTPPPEAAQPAEASKVPLSPRADGKPHLPPIKPSHFRIMASDGGLHDIPKANIERARSIDPLLHVLNPD